MKRILSFLLVIVVISAMAVPAFAVEIPDGYASYNGHVLPDASLINHGYGDIGQPLLIYKINETGVYTALFGDIENDYEFTYDDKVYMFSAEETLSYPMMRYSLVDNEWVFRNAFDADAWWGLSRSVDGEYTSSVVWSNISIYKDANRNEIVIQGSEPSYNSFCDGSSCPATDINVDGNCDDCGMMLSLRSLTYPAFPTVYGSNKHYALVKTKYSGVDAYMYSVFISDATYDIRGETPDTVYQIAVDGDADYIQYVTTDGQTWVEIQNSSVNYQSVGSGIVSQTTVIASTFDWYNEEGERFFPLPLWAEMELVTQGEMVSLTAETVGTMKVLALCGVGLIALLVVLSLFGRRSLIFLKR